MVGKINHVRLLFILVKPKITLRKRISLGEGKNVDFRLTCNVFGNPTPRVSWKRHDAGREIPIPPSFRYENQSRTMVITLALPEYSGTYKCMARNRIGRTEATTFLWICE